MSTRQAILTALLNRVSAIQMANGYATDAGLTVLFGETPMLGPDDPTSAVGLLVGDDQLDQVSLGDDFVTHLPIDVVALAKADIDYPWMTVEAVVGDIKRAIETPGDRTLGGLLTRELQRGRTRSLPRDAGGTTVSAAVQYAATYLDAWGG